MITEAAPASPEAAPASPAAGAVAEPAASPASPAAAAAAAPAATAAASSPAAAPAGPSAAETAALADLAAERSEVARLKAQLAKHEIDLQHERQKSEGASSEGQAREAAEEAAEVLRQEARQLKLDVAHAKGDAKEATDALHAAEGTLADKASEAEHLGARVAELQATVAQQGGALDDLKAELEGKGRLLQASEARFAAAQLVADRVPDLETAVTEATAAKEAASAGAEAARAQAAALGADLATAEEQLEVLAKRNHRMSKEMSHSVRDLRLASAKAANRDQAEEALMGSLREKEALEMERAMLREQLDAALGRELEVRMLEYKAKSESGRSFVMGSSFGSVNTLPPMGGGGGGGGGGGSMRRSRNRRTKGGSRRKLPSLLSSPSVPF